MTDSKELDRPLGDLHFCGAHAPRVLVTAPRRHELGLILETMKPGWMTKVAKLRYGLIR